MPLHYNVRSFRTACADVGMPPFIRAYCGLMVIELAVKDVLNCHGLKHDVQRMLQRLAQNHPHAKKAKPALNSLNSKLSNMLSSLPCQTVANGIGTVRPSVFPDLRYVRHETDWPTNSCSEKDLENLRRHVDQLRHFLSKQCLIEGTV